jgi:hypothetical protein
VTVRSPGTARQVPVVTIPVPSPLHEASRRRPRTRTP